MSNKNSSPAPEKKIVVEVEEDEIRDYINDNLGLCLACGEWCEDGVEPDAENYECPNCGEFKVCGTEQAMIMGHIVLV